MTNQSAKLHGYQTVELNNYMLLSQNLMTLVLFQITLSVDICFKDLNFEMSMHLFLLFANVSDILMMPVTAVANL